MEQLADDYSTSPHRDPRYPTWRAYPCAKSSKQPHPGLPSRQSENEDTLDTSSDEVEGSVGDISITEEDHNAASALLDLHQDGVRALRRFVNRHHGKLFSSVKSLMQHARRHPFGTLKSAEALGQDERKRLKKQDLDAALTMIKLSGQSRAESKASLALLSLRRESLVTLAQEHQNRPRLARLAIEKKNAAERFLALKKFREDYPAVLSTLRWKAEDMNDDTDVVSNVGEKYSKSVPL